MTPLFFSKLTKHDFENGAITDEIFRDLKELATYKEEVKPFQDKLVDIFSIAQTFNLQAYNLLNRLYEACDGMGGCQFQEWFNTKYYPDLVKYFNETMKYEEKLPI